MKYSVAFTSLVSVGALFVACSPADEEGPPPIPPQAGGGSGGMGGSGDAPSGGSGGSSDGGSGNASIGGSGGSSAGGSGTAGGSTGDGGTGGGTGGATGGSTGDGGTGGGTGGSGGDGGGGGGGGMLTLAELVGELDGHLFTVACGDQPNSDDCRGEGWRSNGGPVNACQNSRLEAEIFFDIGGEAGTVYDLEMHFYGIMEPRNYGNPVTREAQGNPSQEPGGDPTPFAWMEVPPGGNYLSTGDNNYNTYELHVYNENDEERMVYFFNADTRTGHYTFGIDYEKTIKVYGGGKVELRIVDANCRQIKNCGSGGNGCADKARTIDISEADPRPDPDDLQQPGLGLAPEHSGQWFLMDALDFKEAAE